MSNKTMRERLIAAERGGEMLLSAPAVLILAGRTAYGDGRDTTPEGMRRGRQMVDMLLSAARAGGFAQGDVLCTLLARGEESARLVDMAEAAIRAAGPDAVVHAFGAMRSQLSGGARD